MVATGGSFWRSVASCGYDGRTTTVFALDRFVHLLPVHGDLRGCLDSEADLITPNVDDGDLDVVADKNTLIALSG